MTAYVRSKKNPPEIPAGDSEEQKTTTGSTQSDDLRCVSDTPNLFLSLEGCVCNVPSFQSLGLGTPVLPLLLASFKWFIKAFNLCSFGLKGGDTYTYAHVNKDQEVNKVPKNNRCPFEESNGPVPRWNIGTDRTSFSP